MANQGFIDIACSDFRTGGTVKFDHRNNEQKDIYAPDEAVIAGSRNIGDGTLGFRFLFCIIHSGNIGRGERGGSCVVDGVAVDGLSVDCFIYGYSLRASRREDSLFKIIV